MLFVLSPSMLGDCMRYMSGVKICPGHNREQEAGQTDSGQGSLTLVSSWAPRVVCSCISLAITPDCSVCAVSRGLALTRSTLDVLFWAHWARTVWDVCTSAGFRQHERGARAAPTRSMLARLGSSSFITDHLPSLSLIPLHSLPLLLAQQNTHLSSDRRHSSTSHCAN